MMTLAPPGKYVVLQGGQEVQSFPGTEYDKAVAHLRGLGTVVPGTWLGREKAQERFGRSVIVHAQIQIGGRAVECAIRWEDPEY